jgi:hypothetical protein
MFLVFCTLIWIAITIHNRRTARLYATFAAVTLVVLIFSYLYLWTAAAAWLVCVALLWFYLRPLDRRSLFEMLAIVGGFALLALLPYLYLLLHRAKNLDETQTLISTHRPDLFRLPEIIGAFIVVLLVVGVRRNRLGAQKAAVIFAASFALLPFVLFNQQVVTGKSMQPFHFENFIANYAVLVGLVILVGNFSRPVSSRALLWLAVLSLAWGGMEVDLPSRARSQSDNVNDQMIPVLLRLKALSLQDGTLTGLRSEGKTPALVFSPHIDVLRFLPTWTAQGTVIGLGGLDFGSASQEERKVYAYLYYCGVDSRRLVELLYDRTDDAFMNYYTRSAMFGHERVLPSLSLNSKPIEDTDIEQQVRVYETYVTSFSREEAVKHPITYVIVLSQSGFDFSHIDRWYERDTAEHIGDYDLYRLKLRSQ